MTATKNKLEFSNSIGYFNKDIVVLNGTTFNLSFNKIASIKIKKKRNVNYRNQLFFMTALLLNLYLFLAYSSIFIEFFCLISSLFFVGLLLFFKSEVLYLQIILCDPKQHLVNFDKKEYASAKEFTKRFTMYRQLNSDVE